MERLGSAYWKFEHGLIDRQELDHVRELTRLEVTTKNQSKHEESAYA